MILKSAVLINALKAAYKELGMTAAYAKLVGMSFTAVTGQFMIILQKFDGTSAVDVQVLSFFKTLTDVSGAAEDATLAFFKVLADNGVVTDAQIVSLFKVLPETSASYVIYAVTVQSTDAGNRYYVDAVLQQQLYLQEGQTYRFDQSHSSNSNHPLRFSTTANGTHASGSAYTTGVVTVGTAGNTGAYVEITVATGAPALYYYCANHSNMGGTSYTPAAGTVSIAVTVQAIAAGNRYYLDGGGPALVISLEEGVTYKFDQSHSSNSNHPLRFSTTAGGTHGYVGYYYGTEYTDGVTTSGTPGNSGAYTQITTGSNIPTLHYYCTNHNYMGNQLNTPSLSYVSPIDTVATSDVPLKTFGKGAQELPTVSETLTKAATLSHADSAGATESFVKILAINRAFSDTSSATDALASAFSTARTDAAAVTDSETTATGKFITSNVFATDDVDGLSSVEDDQEIQFFKNSTDAVGVSESFVRVLNKGAFLTNTAAATDAGLLRSQDFSDFTYFDGDYVGISRALT